MAWAALHGLALGAVVQHLSDPITYAPEGGDAVEVNGVFDRAYQKEDVGEAGVSSTAPAVFFRVADLPTDPMTDHPAITFGGVAYDVSERHPDGAGGILLV